VAVELSGWRAQEIDQIGHSMEWIADDRVV